MSKIAIQHCISKIHLNNNEWFIYKKDILISKTKTFKSKIQFINLKYTENLENFNSLYEEFRNKEIIIELNDNYKIWEIIQIRIS